MILITGAAGSAGGAVLDAALQAKLSVRAMVRSAKDADKLSKRTAVVVADFSDKNSLPGALQGIESVYLVCGPVPQLVELESNMIDACKTAGIRHIVLNSALGAGDFQKSFPSWHVQVEEKLMRSGLAFTILRPNGFFQNIVSYNAGTIRSQSAFYAAMGDAKTSLIDVRDVAAVAAKVLAEPQKHSGKIYALNGPEAVSNGDVAERISRLVGRKVSFVDIPESAQREAMLKLGMPDGQVTAILELQEYYRSGKCAQTDDTVATLKGQPARTLDAYLKENLAQFQSDSVSQGASR